MFRAQCCAVLGFGLMLAAASTEAREVELSVENRMAVESNVFRSSFDRVADGFYAISPQLLVREANSKLDYRFSYRPTYQTYFSTSGIDGLDHRAQGVLTWQPTEIDTVSFSGNFLTNRSLRLEDQSAPLDPVPSLEGADGERLQRSSARLAYDHSVNSRFSVQAAATFSDSDFSQDTSLDSRAFSGQLGTRYILNPLTVVGLSGTIRRRENRGGGTQFSSESEIWDVAAFFQRTLTPTLNVSVQAGPSFIRTTQKAPVAFIPDMKQNSTSYFAAMSLDKRWRHSVLSISYTRSESSGGGTASSSITDNVTLDFDHTLSRRWSFRIFGTWLQSKEISDAPSLIPGDGRQDTTQYRAFTSLTRAISRQLSVVGQFSFFIQDQDDTTSSGEIGGIYSGFLSLRYTFDPVAF